MKLKRKLLIGLLFLTLLSGCTDNTKPKNEDSINTNFLSSSQDDSNRQTNINHHFNNKIELQKDIYNVTNNFTNDMNYLKIFSISNDKVLLSYYKDKKSLISIYSFAENKIIDTIDISQYNPEKINCVNNGFYFCSDSFQPDNNGLIQDKELTKPAEIYIYNYNLELVYHKTLEKMGSSLIYTVSNDLNTLVYLINDKDNWYIKKIDLKSSQESEIYKKPNQPDGVNSLLGICPIKFTSDNKNVLFSTSVDIGNNKYIQGYGLINLDGNISNVNKPPFELQYQVFNNGYFEYDVMIGYKDKANGKATIYDNNGTAVKELVFKNNKESQDCVISEGGKYVCSLYQYLDNKSKTAIYFSVYDVQSGELLKTFNYQVPNSENTNVNSYYIDENSKCIIASINADRFEGNQILQFCY